MTGVGPWAAHGACRDVDPDIFFPPPNGRATAARAVCRPCPVRLACLGFALRHPCLDGVWGATTLRERQAIRRGMA